MSEKFGQNFLIDTGVARREVEYADVNSSDVVLEIGPGQGILTDVLSRKAKKVIAVEIDKELYSLLKGGLSDNVLLINEDVLKVDFNKLPSFNKIVSNLPFQISSELTFKLLELDFDLAVLIYQYEFARRMIASVNTKDYSRLTVNLSYKCSCEILEKVPKGCFNPQPRVDSAIVKLVPLDSPAFFVQDEKFFFNLTRNLFSYRRKKIKNVLKNVYGFTHPNLPFSERRIGELSPEEIAELSNFLHKHLNC